MLRLIDLFSGAGGMSVGFELTGAFTAVGGIDAYAPAVETFFRNHPRANRQLARPLDITTVDPLEYAEAVGNNVDVIVGGPPCQGFSIAGPRSAQDPRNRMVWEFMRFVAALRPAAFVMENVSGLLTTAQRERGQVLEKLRDEYHSLGYSTSWRILNSVDYRVPQRRKRLFLVGLVDTAREFEFPLPPCADEGRLFLLPEAVQTVGNALSDLPTPNDDEPQDYDSEAQTWLQRFLRERSEGIYNHSLTRHSSEMSERLRKQKHGTRLYANWNHSWYRLNPDEPSPAVKENHRAPFVHFSEPRVTSPRECARLQTFPDRFVFWGNKTQQLVQVGNAVPCIMAAHIATALAKQLQVRVPVVWDDVSHPYETDVGRKLNAAAS